MNNFFLILAFLTSFICYGQNQANIWYFGENAGLDFNSGEPEFLLDGALNTVEGCATISDPSGNLLFYTDGSFVYNANHEIMSNGGGLSGNFSSTQSAIIVPYPENNNLYYIFSTDAEAGADGMRYSLVDMQLNGGLGDVTSTKNILLIGQACEKLSAIQNASENGYWVLGHKYGNNEFAAFSITPSGIQEEPVISAVGSLIALDLENTIGAMKFSPDGNFLALANSFGLNNIELFQFDNSTGQVSSPLILKDFEPGSENGDPLTYSVEFSADSQVLYGSSLNGEIYQFDLSQSYGPAILNSEFQINITSGETIGALQIGPDEKIYISNFNQTEIDRINNPTVLGINCNYEEDAVYLGGKIAAIGLPPFVQSFFIENSIQTENTCFGSTTLFSLANEPISADWNFDDPQSGSNTANGQYVSHDFSAPGVYEVTVEIVTNTGETLVYSKEVEIFEIPVANPVPDKIKCLDPDENASFDLSSETESIIGSQNEAEVFYFYLTTENTDTISIVDEADFSFQGDSIQILAEIQNPGNFNCSDTISFKLIKVFAPQVPDSLPTVSFCTENLEDSIAYNLNTAIPESFYSASDQVHFYLDENLSQEIESPADFKFGQNDISIFIETAKTEPGFCAALTTIILEKFHKPTPPTEIEILSCSENGNAEALFSTTGIKDSLTSGNPDFGVVFIRNSDTLINLPEEIVTENTEITALVFNNQYPACMAFSEVIFTVLPSLQIDLKDRYFLCPNSSITLQAPENADYYQWSTGETTSEITVSEPGNYSLSVEKFQRGEICSSTHEFEVIASEPAELLSVEKEDWTNTHNKIKLNVSGSGNYQYSINGGDYQNEPVFDNLGVGEFQVSIRDLNGCNPVEFEVYLLMHPEFFTPNSDGINDYWQISQAQREPDMKIYIFDRYGKLLLRLDPFSQGWDGTFNGKIMPSNDYWFRVVREDSENYRGNFTLKR